MKVAMLTFLLASAVFAQEPKMGQTIAEVRALKGKPTHSENVSQFGEEWQREVDRWNTQTSILEVRYVNGRVTSFGVPLTKDENKLEDRRARLTRLDQQAGLLSFMAVVAMRTPGKEIDWSKAGSLNTDVGMAVYLSQVCPAIFRKLLPGDWRDIQLGAGDLRRECDANGFILFDRYIYTGR
jgi:hypothetical protein